MNVYINLQKKYIIFLNIEDDMRVVLSFLRPNINEIIKF